MKKIAIIEDDQLFHEALQRALKKAGYQVAGAFSLAQGYEVLKEHPSLLIIDRNLPDGDGLELCRKARASGGIPALFLTARDEEEEMIKAFDLGADDYLVKPFSMAVLLKHIEAILRRIGKNYEIFQYENLKIDFERKKVFRDCYVVFKDILVDSINFNDDEVMACKFVSIEEFKEIIKKGESTFTDFSQSM